MNELRDKIQEIMRHVYTCDDGSDGWTIEQGTNAVLALFPSEPKDIKILQETLGEIFKQRDMLATKLSKLEEEHSITYAELSSLKARMEVGEIEKVITDSTLYASSCEYMPRTSDKLAKELSEDIVKHLKGEKV